MTREEAIKVVKERLNYYESEKRLRAACELLIPELAEGDDERIINQLITLVNSTGEILLIPTNKEELIAWLNKCKESLHVSETCKENADSFTDDDERMLKRIRLCLDECVHSDIIRDYERDECVAYLEKQKEQKPVEVKPRFKIGDTLKKKNKDYTFVVDKIQGGFYLTSDKHFFPIEEQDSWELLEQKPAIKLVFPKFRVGDIIRNVYNEWDKMTKRISYVGEHGYYFDYRHLGDKVGGGSFGFCFEDYYELVEQKPAEWVLPEEIKEESK